MSELTRFPRLNVSPVTWTPTMRWVMIPFVQRTLPSGTVTFLCTDIEGSTRLLHELGPDRYAEALADHRRILRKALSAQDGVEVDARGDAFFIEFTTAPV